MPLYRDFWCGILRVTNHLMFDCSPLRIEIGAKSRTCVSSETKSFLAGLKNQAASHPVSKCDSHCLIMNEAGLDPLMTYRSDSVNWISPSADLIILFNSINIELCPNFLLLR